MALTSSSNLTDALAQYNDNLAWTGNTIKAGLALEAVRWLLVNRPADASDGGTRLNYASLEQEKEKLEAFMGAVGNSNRTSFTRGTAKL